MKKLVLFLMLVVGAVVANAQKIEGSLDLLKNEVRVNFELNYSKARIHGMTEAEFAKYEEDWYKDMPQIVGDFLDGLNAQLSNYVRFGNYPTAKYTVRVDVLDVATDGSCDSDVLLLDANSNVVAKIEGLQGAGGTFGTKLYLIKRGAAQSGRRLGKIIFQKVCR